MRKNCFSKKKNIFNPPPKKKKFTQFFLLNVGNNMKREENMKF